LYLLLLINVFALLWYFKHDLIFIILLFRFVFIICIDYIRKLNINFRVIWKL